MTEKQFWVEKIRNVDISLKLACAAAGLFVSNSGFNQRIRLKREKERVCYSCMTEKTLPYCPQDSAKIVFTRPGPGLQDSATFLTIPPLKSLLNH